MTTSAVSLDLTKAFDTVSHATLGSLSNDDDAAMWTANKTIDLLSKTTTLQCSTLFSTFLCHRSTTTTWKCLIFFFFSFCELRNSPLEFNSWFANIWRIKRVGIGAVKFETTRIHFWATISLPLPSSLLKLAVTKRAGSVWHNGSSPLTG